jgi:hypothetical protein
MIWHTTGGAAHMIQMLACKAVALALLLLPLLLLLCVFQPLPAGLHQRLQTATCFEATAVNVPQPAPLPATQFLLQQQEHDARRRALLHCSCKQTLLPKSKVLQYRSAAHIS